MGLVGTLASLLMTLGINCLTIEFVGYGVSAVALGGVGYFVHGVEQRQNELLKERRELLSANRARRTEEATA